MAAAVRRIQTGSALSAFGAGFTVPYLYVYVAQVRGLGAGAAGLVLAVFALAALVVLPFVGRAIDRRGPLPVLVGAALMAASGAAGLGFANGVPLALLSASMLGAGTAVMQPALATLIVWCSDAETRTRAFATQFFLQNLGLGAGGLLGGQLVDVHRPGSFTLLFSFESAMFLVLAGIVLSVRVPGIAAGAGSAEAVPGESEGAAPGGVRALLAHRAMVQFCALAFAVFFVCYGQFESGLSAYGVEAAGVSPSTLGVALAANTAMIVVAQFAVLRLVERRRRSRVIAVVGLLWAVAWAAAGCAGLGHGGRATATGAFITAYALFGLGETMLSPTLAPLVADLAPAGTVGRYNSAFALVKQLALAAGPAVGGPMAAAAHTPYVLTFLALSLGVTVLALRLGRRLAPAQDLPLPARSRVVAAGGPAAERITPDPAGA
ncbi:MFS transporter [Streptomyces sulfonofaciens]|uniref:MFS transporter n=1 Tax=Streptomyces sulfonofaciens TaxID=68272 RepID=UPI0016774A1C|nr:MFS transporter [Streptomyces sulfonofaciens]